MSVTLQEAAKAAFHSQIEEKLVWLSTKVWASNVAHDLKETNELIRAAIFLGGIAAGEIRELRENEIEELIPALVAMRKLEMNVQARELVATAFKNCGIPIDNK